MKGTFKPGDKLIIEKVPFAQIRKGDLIIFSREADGNNDFVVHRVVDIYQNGLITRGDNCRDRDKELVIEENIIGRVIQFDRMGKIHRGWNGRRGMFWAKILGSRMHLIKVVDFFLRKPYIMIRKTGIVAKFWHPEIRIIHFETQDGALIKYVHKGKTIAICWTDTNRWQIRKLYDLIIWPKYID